MNLIFAIIENPERGLNDVVFIANEQGQIYSRSFLLGSRTSTAVKFHVNLKTANSIKSTYIIVNIFKTN